jgi:uncharacterized repeat protein (TIGR03803 family)
MLNAGEFPSAGPFLKMTPDCHAWKWPEPRFRHGVVGMHHKMTARKACWTVDAPEFLNPSPKHEWYHHAHCSITAARYGRGLTSMYLRSLLPVVVASLICHTAFADSAIEPLVGFEMGPGNPGDAPLLLHPNGNFYATSAMGGAFGYTNPPSVRNGYGTIFQVNTRGEVGALSFANAFGGIPGDTPNPTLIMSSDGWLWGSTTKGAPAESNGTVFRVHPDQGIFQTMYNVSGGGTNPVSNLVRDPATGRFWGTAGATTFSIDELTGAYAVGGVAPTINTSEVADGAGFRWGITAAGGTSGNGTIYKTEIANSTTTTVVNFSGTSGSFQGKTPLGPLVKDGGFLWGVTKEGGSGTSPGLGVIFKLEIATGAYTSVVRFGSLTGVNAGMNTPSNALAADGKGYLWGFASPGVANGANGWSLYKIKTSDSSLTRVSEFGPGTNNTVLTALNNAAAPKGRMPYAGLTGSATSPYLWGTTSEGGTKGFGTLFRYDPETNHYEVMVNFTGTTGAALGGRANGRLHLDENDVVWGSTEVGGTGNSGTVFKFDPATRVFTTIHSFNLGGNGGFPRSGLVDGDDGFLWGTASSSPGGVIYRVNKSTSTLGVAYAFPSSPNTEGTSPEGDLVPDGAGNLWGTTRSGGTSGNGVLYKFVPSTLTYTAMVKFSGADTAPNPGRQPSGPLVLDDDGNIWGTTIYNVFKYSPGSATYTNVFNYNENASVLPVKSVSVGTISKTAVGNIRFLGTEGTKELTTSGDTGRMSYRAVVYEIDPATNVTTKLHSLMEAGAGLAGPAALSPAGGLYEHTDGYFYGITKNGGVTEDLEPAGGGMIYRVGTGPAVMTQPYWTPTVTNFYTLVSNNTATLRGYANPNDNAINCEFEWGPTTAFGNTVSATLSSGAGGSGDVGSIYSAALSDLTASTTYFYRFIAKTVSGEPSYGPVRSFVTGSQASFPLAAEIRVESPIGQSLTDNVGSLDLGQRRVGQSVKQAVIIRNLSAAASLTGLSVGISGGDATDFVITTPLGVNTLAGGVSGGLLITFTPSGAGPRSTTLTITSNDSDESSFEVQLVGEGIVEPEIEVDAPGPIVLESGNNYNFGSSAISSGTARTFTIRNTGNAELNTLSVSPSGANVGDFTVTTDPSASVAAGGSTTFVVTFTPSSGGLRSTQLEISSNDGDENPFYIQLSGTGITAPEIEVLDGTTLLTDNSSTIDFGTVSLGSSPTKTITVRNTGSATLIGIFASVVNGDTADFTAGNLSNSVNAGNETTFTLTFTPQNLGGRTAILRIASDDADENPFDITLTGSLAAPEGPVFTVQPQSRLAFLGGPVSFDPTVTGDPVITYKWKKGTAFIPGATASSYTIQATKAADAGAYSVIADNPVGAEVPSSTAYLGLVTISHGVQTLKVGSTLKLTCTVAAPKLPGVTVKYDWFRQGSVDPITNGTKLNGAIVSGATTGALSIAKIGTADADIYTCLVTLDTPGNDPELHSGSTMVNVVDAVPDVAALPPESVSVSEPIDITITATNFPTSFSATGLPAGLKFDTKTGRLTGKPTTPSKQTLGVYTPSKISFKATNPFGTSVAEDFYLTIEPLEAGVVGTFSGLVARSGHSNFGMGGHVKITVAASGIVSGDVTLAGQKHAVVGSLDVSLGNNPTFDLIVKRSPASLGNLRLTGNISPPDDLLSGTITDDRFEMLDGMIDLGDPAEPDLINGTMQDARFRSPRSLVLRPDGAGYVADTGNHVIRFVDPDSGNITTFVGNPTAGSADGTGAAASFNGPEGLALDIAGNLYIADAGNSTIRKVTPAGVVTTFAGAAGQVGITNGTGTNARFSEPCALCFDPAGNLIVADRGNHMIRKITPAGVVTTLAGKADAAGHKEGSGIAAQFDTPSGITYDPVLKALFVADSLNRVIRKVTLTGAVTTYAGSPRVEGEAEGLFANTRFIEPVGIASLGNGTLIVADTLLVQLNPNGTSGVISEMLDTLSSSDNPTAIAYNAQDEGLIVAQDSLHSLASYQSSGLPREDALVSATRNPWSTASNVPLSQQGLYNAAIETTAAPGDASYPQGSGYVQVSISKTGTANWTGKAADGTAFTFSTFLDADLHIPLHASLYKNTGSLQGDTFINPTTQDLVNHTTPAFDWYKIPQPLSSTDRSYKNGFYRHELEVSGGKYTPNDLHGYLGLSSSPATMKLDFTASLIAAFEQSFTLTDPNIVSITTSVKSTTLKIDPKTGIFTGSFKEGSPAVTVPFAGILIDYEAGADQSGHGHYLLPESSAANAPIRSASMTLVPNVGP